MKPHECSSISPDMPTEGDNAYDPVALEASWQDRWDRDRTNAFTLDELRSARNPFFNLMMFPYPSAEGLHVGNIYAFTGADVYGRYKADARLRRLRADRVRRLRDPLRELRAQDGGAPHRADPRQRGQLPSPAAPDRGDVRLGPHGRHHRPRGLQVDGSGSSCSSTGTAWPSRRRRRSTGARRA